MASSNVEKNRNATSSWSGYIHQGKVGFLVALRQLRWCIENSTENLEQYAIRYENAEDFDIIDNEGRVVSRHQVKAYVDGKSREKYSPLFNIQKRDFGEFTDKNGNKVRKEYISEEGFQIHSFDGKGNIKSVDVSTDSRYVHVIVDVVDFNLSRCEYLKKDGRRQNYTDNNSCVQLYPYDSGKNIYYCPLSQDDNNDMIRDYCIDEIKEILVLRDNQLKDNTPHFSNAYMKYVGSLLDHSIGRAHNESSFPEILFGELIAIIEEETPRDEVYEMKNTLIYSWEKYHLDYIDDICEHDFGQMDIIITNLLSMSKEDFLNFSRMVLPNVKQNETCSKLFNISTLENIFYVLLEKTKDFSFKSYNYLDDENNSYRVSLIDIQNRPGRVSKLIQEIIDNSEFLKATFNHDFLINRDIDGIPIGTRIDELEATLDTRYRSEWNTGVENNIFKPSMEFISINKTLEKELNIPED